MQPLNRSVPSVSTHERKKALDLVLNEPMVDVSLEALSYNPALSPRARIGKSPRRPVLRRSPVDEELSTTSPVPSPRLKLVPETPDGSDTTVTDSPRSKTPHKRHRKRSSGSSDSLTTPNSEDESPLSSPREDPRKYPITTGKRPHRHSFSNSGISSSTEESSESEGESPRTASEMPEVTPARREQMHRTREKSKSLEMKPSEEMSSDSEKIAGKARRFSSNLEALEENVVQEEEGDKELRKRMGRQNSWDDKVIKLGAKIRSPKRQAIRPVSSVIISSPDTVSEDMIPSVLFVGKPDSGKSSIIHRMGTGGFGVMDKFSKQTKVIKVPYIPRASDSLAKKLPTNLYIQDTIDDNVQKYLVQGVPPCIVCVFSVASTPSFERVEEYALQIREFYSDDADLPKIVIVGNKSDLSESRSISSQSGKILAEKLQGTYLEVSAKTGDGIANLLEQIYVYSRRVTSFPKIGSTEKISPDPPEVKVTPPHSSGIQVRKNSGGRKLHFPTKSIGATTAVSTASTHLISDGISLSGSLSSVTEDNEDEEIARQQQSQPPQKNLGHSPQKKEQNFESFSDSEKVALISSASISVIISHVEDEGNSGEKDEVAIVPVEEQKGVTM